MTEHRRTALKELQTLDMQVVEAQKAIHAFDPKFEAVEQPALALESESERTRARLKEMELGESRLELSVQEKKTRQLRLDERVGSVRNLREEAAVTSELEMVKRALQSDEQEALALLDQIQKMKERLIEVDEGLAAAKAEFEPAMAALVTARDEAKATLESLNGDRERYVADMHPGELKLYDAIRRGGRTIAVSEITEDGACGHCFGVVPLQFQNEILHGTALIRCESCGVILAAPDPEAVAAEAAAAEAAEAEAAAAADDATEASDDSSEASSDEEDTAEK
ncbi:MAG: hypothetical protein P8L30_08210 [Longimicrobiales bacterium]|nr:hypothetical protein [Longimicrobiales bacterium]